MDERFNIRVYALIIVDDHILVTDEYRFGRQFTKFPGGGLEHGEGITECLVRECREELGQEVELLSHFYTTEFYQESAFRKTDQIVSIYYRAKPVGELNFSTKELAFDFDELVDEAQIFRWIPLAQMSVDDVTFPIDKHVVELLHAGHS